MYSAYRLKQPLMVVVCVMNVIYGDLKLLGTSPFSLHWFVRFAEDVMTSA